MLRTPTFLLCLSLALCAASPAFAASEPNLASHPVYATYQFGRESKVADMGTQPKPYRLAWSAKPCNAIES